MIRIVLLVACATIAVGTILYFFFWNRVFGSILGVLARLALWTQNSSAAWVGIGSAHISLISGTITLRDVRYHSSNQTFRIVKCRISWRWWIRKVAEEEDLAETGSDGHESVSDLNRKHAPRCRIHASVEGLEWYMYNRTAAFDNILSQVFASNPELVGSRTKSRESNSHSLNQSILVDGKGARVYTTGRRAVSALQLPSFINKSTSWLTRQLPDLDPKNLLPMSFGVVKGAITMGNHTTESLLLAQFAEATGTYGIVQSKSMLDEHKQLLRISFEEAAINCVENPDYWTSDQSIGRAVNECFAKSNRAFAVRPVPLAYSEFKKLWLRCRNNFSFFNPRGRRYADPEKPQRKKDRGKRAREEVSHVGADFTILEYAVDRKLLEAPKLELLYYADVPGHVPDNPTVYGVRDESIKPLKGIELMDIGNGDLPPEWGVDVVVHGGAVHYGPWADRQRSQLQRVFFPQTFFVNDPTATLSPGDVRICTCLKLFFEFRGVTIIHVPFREASKNWQWDGVVDVPHPRKQREPASIQVRLGDKTSVKYLVPMVSTAEGYTAELDVFLDSISVTSSLNDIRLLEADSCFVRSFLPSPLRWNSERSWDFDLSLSCPILFIIRDHINMLTDLGKDWSSGPPSDFNTFVPITYNLNLILRNFELHLYGNDHNIIDRPLDKRDNVLFNFKGDVLKNTTSIPSNRFRPLYTKASFSIDAPDVVITLTLPRWNTHGLTASSEKQLTNIGQVGLFHIDGSYTYCAEVRKDCTDKLKLDIQVHSLSLKLFGWIVRHVMVLRENYFGGFTQYSTTREYLSKRDRGIAVGDPLDLKYRRGKNNIFHLDLSLIIKNCTAAFPASVVGFEHAQQEYLEDIDIGSSAVCLVPELQLQLRLHDFFMDMSLNMDPITVSVVNSCPDRLLLSHKVLPSIRQMSISGIQITANRLFGPQPHTSTYVCIWNISVGDVKGFLGTMEAQTLIAAAKCFGQGFSDPFNAPASEFVIAADRDATFLKITVDGLDMTWKNAPAVVRLSLAEGLRLAYNNIAETRHRKLTSLAIPVIDVQVLLTPNTTKQWLEAGRIRTGVHLVLYSSPRGWQADAEKQRSFLRAQDAETNRFASIISPTGPFSTSSWSSNLYLQTVYAPRLGKKLGSRSATLSASARRPFKGNFVESESDDDRLVSEADRDKRLAESRPTSSSIPWLGIEDGQSSSPVDESDESDSDGSHESWSDYLELGEDGNRDASRIPYLMFCRKFELRRGSTVLDCQTGFVSGKEVPYLQGDLFPDKTTEIPSINGEEGPPDMSQLRLNASDTENRSYTCVDIKDTGIFLTPLCLTVLKEALDQHDSDERSPELRLDELMLERIEKAKEASISIYDMRLSSARLRVVHEVPELTRIQSTMTTISEDCRAFSLTNVGLEGVQCIINLPSANNSASADSPSAHGRFSVRKVSGSVASLYRSTLPIQRIAHAPSTAIESSVTDFTATFVRSRWQTSYDVSEVRLFRSSAEVMLSAIAALRTPLKEVATAQKRRASLTRLSKKHLMCSILARIKGITSKDLLSSVQPAFFVQSGRPHQLRGDNNWKLLFHLRHSLSNMSKEDYDSLKNELEMTRTDAELDALLQEHQIPWSVEEGLPLSKIDLIESLFTKQVDTQEIVARRHDNRPVISMGFQANSVRLSLDGGDPLLQSSLTLRGISLRADLLTRRLMFEVHSMSPYSSTVRSFRPTMEYVDYGSISAMLSLHVSSMQITLFPSVIELLQNAVHVWWAIQPTFEAEVGSDDGTSDTSSPFLKEFLANRVIACDLRVVFDDMLIEAAAESLVFELLSRHFSSCCVGHLTQPLDEPTCDFSINHTAGFEELAVKARTRGFTDRDADTLASITALGGVSCLLLQNHTPVGSNLRGTIHATSMELNVPRSAIRLYKLIEQWRQDYLDSIDAMIKSLFTEIRHAPERHPKSSSTKNRGFGVNINASLTAASVVLQVMHGSWLAWSAQGIIGYLTERPGVKGTDRSCGLQFASHNIRITSTAGDSSQRPSKIVLDMPSISASGSFSPDRSGFLISLGLLDMTIKPSHWDSLLSVQQKFGQDFNDLLLILSDAKNKHPQLGKQMTSSRRDSVPFHVTARFEGFKIGLEGITSTLFLECEDIDAMISSKGSPQWRVTLTDLALYLSPTALAKKKHPQADRTHLPALVSINLQVVCHQTSQQEWHRHLEIDITKLHAVLQAHLMGDIGDFVDQLQAEVMLRKEQRASELLDFKQKAKDIMKTFNFDPRKSSMVKQRGFFDNSLIAITMVNFGAAFPLNLERRQFSRPSSSAEVATKALLLSIKSFSFETRCGESGEALMKNFCFQFISRFDPSNPEDFSAGRHHTLNQVLYPEMTARMRTKTSSYARRIFASASISGFILDLDPSMTSYIFALIDAYRHGKQRVEQLALSIPRSAIEAGSAALASESGGGSKAEALKRTVTSSVDASLSFKSGTVRMHCTTKDSSVFASISPDWSGKTYQILDSDAELFRLPELSLSAEYRADVRQLGTPDADVLRVPVLVFRCTVHSSRNALRPLLLAFVSGVVHNVEERMKQMSHATARSPSSIRHSLSSLTLEERDLNTVKSERPASSSFQLFISLRIDKSRLEFTCRPDVNVIAGVNWESGGFILTMGPGAEGVSMSASIEGLTIGLKHGFLSDDSAHIDARNLIISINFSKPKLSSGRFINSISVVVDTEFSGGVRYSRLQDFLCFKAVWLDHIPIFKGEAAEDSISPSRLSTVSSTDHAPKQGFDTVVVVRVRHIRLEADLGQSISTVTFDLQTALIRTRMTSKYSELTITFAHVEMQAKGNLSGHLRMPDFAFRTVRKRHTGEVGKHSLSRMLELNLTSGTLDVQLQSDWLWLLQYRAEPLEATIFDDWSTNSSSDDTRDRQLHLHCSVSGSKVIAMMTIMAIPKLLMYAGKLRSSLEVQREGASRESSAFRSTRLPKPDNALSEVANAMFRSARAKLRESESLSYVINQHMKLQLSELVFVVLPRSQGDNELARFIGRDVMAQLHRTMQQVGMPPHRDLQLSLSHMSISQLLKQGFDPRLPGKEFDLLTASDRSFPGTENLIFSLPAMNMRMITDEVIEEGSKLLPYDFVSNFVRREGQIGENIHISFNIRLYSWLTVLRKTFTREFKRVQEVAESRTTNSPLNFAAPKLYSPDTAASPFAFGSDGSYSPPESRPTSGHSSRPGSPIRSRSVESIIVSTPGRAQSSQHSTTMTSPKSVPSEATNSADQVAIQSPPTSGEATPHDSSAKKSQEVLCIARSRKIERLTVKQLGEATPDVTHPFFARRAGFNLEEALPQYVHEYATVPIEEIMKGLVKLYSKQLD